MALLLDLGKPEEGQGGHPSQAPNKVGPFRPIAEARGTLDRLLVVQLMPGKPEPLGLLALMRLHLARIEARFTSSGELVLIAEQDRSQWNRAMIAEGIVLIERAAAMHNPGPYQVEAAIAACHAEAESWMETDWQQIVVLYNMLLLMTPSPVIRLNRAVAMWQMEGAAAALEEVDSLTPDLQHYHLFHAIRAALLRELGQRERSREAEMRALALTQNRAVRSLRAKRLLEW